MMIFEEASGEVRQALVPVRAAEWRGAMNVAQFAARNERLYGHPYGLSRMRTFTLKDAAGEIVASMDLLLVPFLVRVGGHCEEREGGLIASVVTPPARRGKGHCTRLLGAFFENEPPRPYVLFSDVGPKFYERFGFRAFPATCIEAPPQAEGRSEVEPLRLSDFVATLRESRRKTLSAGESAVALFPSEQYFDWHVERYRFFAETVGESLPERLFWRVRHGDERHLVAAVPDFIAKRLDALWIAEDCGECRGVLGGLARKWGLDRMRYWARKEVEGGYDTCPMISVPSVSAGLALRDIQLCDWW